MEERVFRSRIAEVRRSLMQPSQLDLLIAYSDDVLSPGAVRYLTDFDVYAMYGVVLVPKQGDVVLAFGLHHSAYLVRVRQAAIADHFVGTYAPGAMCAQLLSECGATRSPQVGLVGGRGMFSSIDADIRSKLAQASLIELDEEFWRLVHSGSGEALAGMRRSATIAVRSIEEARRDIDSGETSPGRIAARATLAARRFGADIQNREMVQVRVAAGWPLPARLAPPTHHPFTRGSAFAIEVSPAYAGARTVCVRSFVQAKYSGHLHRADAVHASICALARPGAIGGALVRDAKAVAAKAGMELANSEIFSGIGLNLRQPPLQSAELGSGMVLVVRADLKTVELGTIHRADTVLVTEQGCEILTAD